MLSLTIKNDHPFIGELAYRVARFFNHDAKTSCKAYFRFNPVAKQNVYSEQTENAPETWRDYYTRVYGEIPDFAKHLNNGYHRDLDVIKPDIDIAQIIYREEVKYKEMLERNRALVLSKYSDVTKLTGETLAKLHHTHGCDPTMLEEILDVFLPEQLHQDYMIEYAKHKVKSKSKDAQ